MQPDQAKSLLEHYGEICCYEQGITSRVIAAIPDGRGDYTPDAKSMKALDLAWHIASSECWFLEGVINGAFPTGGEPGRPAELSTAESIVKWYQARIGPLWEQVAKLDAAKLVQSIDFYGMFNLPAVAYLSLLSRHSIHHRGQLSAYLRPMGGKVPGIYGPSADEPIQPAASASS